MDACPHLRYAESGMETILLTAVLAAVLSSLGTVGLVYLLIERRYRQQAEHDLRDWIEQMADLVESRVKAGVLDGIAEADLDERLAAVEARVRAGVIGATTDDAVRELLEQWAEEIENRVRQGVTDAVANLAHPDVIRDATLNVTEVGTNLIAQGLNSLLRGTGNEQPDQT